MKKKRRGNKRDEWLNFYLDRDNKKTFMNGTQAAMAAGYKSKDYDVYSITGSKLKKYWSKDIAAWIEEFGLSNNYLKGKLIELVEAKETKFFPHETAEGFEIAERVVKALGIQRQSLDMALKVKGAYAPEKKEFSIPNGLQIEATIKPDTPAKEAAQLYSQMLKKGEAEK